METNQLTNTREIAKEKGNALESGVEHIFKIGGFKTERNIFIAKYEIDVKASIGDRNIIIECKNYQNSELIIRNLIHEWNSKNQIIKAHKIILVIAGLSIKDTDYALASEFDMEIWSQEVISELFNLTLKPNELRERLLQKISLKAISISERYRDNINYLVIKPLLTGIELLDEFIFSRFNKWLRSFILTKLEMIETTKEMRSKYIELFEGCKTKTVFLNLFKVKRKEEEYWNTVKNRLQNEQLLSNEQQSEFLSYMDEIIKEYSVQKEFFKEKDFKLRNKKLIVGRLYHAILNNSFCNFQTTKIENKIVVYPLLDGAYTIEVTKIDQKQGNVLNWILISELYTRIDANNTTLHFYWDSSSFDDCIEKIFRIFDEFFDLSEDDQIKDYSFN